MPLRSGKSWAVRSAAVWCRWPLPKAGSRRQRRPRLRHLLCRAIPQPAGRRLSNHRRAGRLPAALAVRHAGKRKSARAPNGKKSPARRRRPAARNRFGAIPFLTAALRRLLRQAGSGASGLGLSGFYGAACRRSPWPLRSAFGFGPASIQGPQSKPWPPPRRLSLPTRNRPSRFERRARRRRSHSARPPLDSPQRPRTA